MPNKFARPRKPSNWFSAHTHSCYSATDGIGKVEDIVEKVARLGQPAIALTDHGNMAGTVELYNAGRKYGVKTFIGLESYLLEDRSNVEEGKSPRFHIGIIARNYNGYKHLIRLNDKAHTRPNFNKFPRITFKDLALLSANAREDIIILTGCFYGLIQQKIYNKQLTTAKKYIQLYKSLFPHTFIEVQNHNITHDDGTEDFEITNKLFALAKEFNLPVMATQDSHYLDTKNKIAHNLMKTMIYRSENNEFPGDSFHVASTKYVKKYYTDDQWEIIEKGAGKLLSLYDMEIPQLHEYKAQIPFTVATPKKAIRTNTQQMLRKMDVEDLQKYQDRLDYEIDIINKLDMAGYFMLVYKYVQWCNQEKICIEARGSANGSLVCFLLGITQVDPIKWGLIFERFLSLDRISPPDIDMDVEDTKRERLIEFLENNFDTARIGTWSKLGINEEDKGSILVSYLSYLTRDADKHENTRIRSDIREIEDVRRYSKKDSSRDYLKDYEALKQLSELTTYKSYGLHAGGILVSGKNQKIEDFVPKQLVASSEKLVTQFDMDNVEKLGFLKLDILGQTVLSVMSHCQKLIGRKDINNFSWIPYDDQKALYLIREGVQSNGIFHAEGYTKSRGYKELKPKSTRDVILGGALYMPSAMDTGQTDLFIQRRFKLKPDEKKYIHPAFEKALSPTHGAVIFQEQVINIMRGLGMSIEGINTFFKIVKTSGKNATEENIKRLEKVRDEFNELCIKNGIKSKSDIEKAWEKTSGFVSYGFNEAHATGYGIRTYRCAYLKAYYPLEYMTALLACFVGKDKEELYIREAKRIGINIKPPTVNGGVNWTMNKKDYAINKGLRSIKGVGEKACLNIVENQPYTSIADLIKRTESKKVTGGKDFLKNGETKGVIRALKLAGALSGLPNDDTE